MIEKKINIKKIIKEWIGPVVAAIVIVILINKLIFFNVYVPTPSMVPTINPNDKLMVTRIYNMNKIQRGDIIVFYSEELDERLIKRVIGLPGDHIVIHNGTVNINGSDIKEEYVKNNADYNGTFDVPKNKFLFLGDNRAGSADARVWINPYIDEKFIEGKAVFRFYPFDNVGVLQ